MEDNNRFTNPFQSLRQGLKRLLRLRKPPQGSATIGSGILRKAETPSAYEIPQFSTVSLFPDFGASDFDVRQYAVRNQGQEYLPVPTSARKPPSHRTLLPATSLSQFDLRKTFAQQGEVKPHRVVYQTVSEAYLAGVSRQASLASLAPSTLHKSTSSLRIRKSQADLRSSVTSPQPVRDDIGSGKHRHDADSPAGSRSLRRSSQITSSAATRSSTYSTSSRHQSRSPLTSVRHFESFLVLDTAMPGCPVTATSSSLAFIFQRGEEFFLNNHEAEGTSIDIVSGVDACGNPVTHLVLFSPLIAPSSGRSRFMLVSLVEVSEFIQDTATLPELDTISEEGSASPAGAVATPTMHPSPEWTALGHELSVEDLLGGCSLSDERPPLKGRDPVQDDIWLDIAFSEGKSRGGRSNSCRTQGSHASPTPTSRSTRSSVSSVDDVLTEFMSSLQTLYSDFFLLGKSPLDDDCYEICNVSPTVYKEAQYIHGHLSRTPRATIDKLSASLTQETPFAMTINWGDKGEPKQLYCSPLYGQRSLTWLCFLVEPQMPILW